MEAISTVRIEKRLQTGFVDIKTFGYKGTQSRDVLKVEQVSAVEQINLKNRDQEKQAAKEAEVVIPAIIKDLETKINQIKEIGMEFTQFRDSGRTIVKIIEKSTGKVIRVIPTEEFMKFVEKMDQMIGILFDEKA